MPINPQELNTLGNKALLRLSKTAFLCSRNYPPAIKQLTFLWAMEQRFRNCCVLSGFHSQLEQSVLRYFLQAEWQPVIFALGRGIQPATRFEYEVPITAGRLLLISPFEPAVQTVTPDTADIRNLLITDLADDFFVPFLAPGGNLDQLLQREELRHKPILTLDLPENRPLLARGARVFQPSALLGQLGTAD